MAKRVWQIVSYKLLPSQHKVRQGPIETSKGRPYRELKSIARRMNCNGEGMCYIVEEA